MRFYKSDIVFQEIPGQISLAFYICGCPVRCPGCHSPELWSERSGRPLSEETFRGLLKKYRSLATNVLFMGGEWHAAELIHFLRVARAEGFHTSLYTGLEDVSAGIRAELDFLKLGPWRAELGGLDSLRTNQILWNLRTGQKLNFMFQTK